MSTAYKFDLTQDVTITIKNVYDPTKANETVDTTGLDMLAGLQDTQFATGAASLGTPHIDEYDEYGKVLVAEKNGFKGANAFALRLYGSDLNGGANQYVVLFPGDEFKITAKGAAALYYAAINAENIEVTAEPAVITPTPYVPEVVKVFDTTAEEELDRTTGVGDDGDPINFDSEAYTEEMIDEVSA
jgi:hypothetical protein